MNKFLRSTPYYQRKQRLRPSADELAGYIRDLTAVTSTADGADTVALQKQAIAFEKLKQMNRPAVPHLLPMMNHPLAQELIRRFGFYVVDVLIESLYTHPERTEDAFHLLSEIDDKRVRPVANRYLNHENPTVQRYARQIVEKYSTAPNFGETVVYWCKTVFRRFGLTIW